MSDQARLEPATPHYEVGVEYALDIAPLAHRLGKLTERQRQIMNANWRWTKLTELDWPMVQEVGTALTAVESDKAIAEGREVADVHIKADIAEQLTALDARIRHMLISVWSSYGIPHYASPLITQGQAETMLWVMTRIPQGWFPEATDITEKAKPFDEVAAEQEAEQATADEIEASREKPVTVVEDEEQPAPAGWEQPVPTGSWKIIDEWIHGPMRRKDPDKEEMWERAHRAKIAEVRRRGPKQRKVVLNGTDKLLPLGYVPPYLRIAPATEAEPAVATIAELTKLDDGDALHLVITNGGVRYWLEQADA